MKHKAGLYRFESGGDLFANSSKEIGEGWGETRDIRLTEKEANTLFQNQLFQRLGFWGWTYLSK